MHYVTDCQVSRVVYSAPPLSYSRSVACILQFAALQHRRGTGKRLGKKLTRLADLCGMRRWLHDALGATRRTRSISMARPASCASTPSAWYTVRRGEVDGYLQTVACPQDFVLGYDAQYTYYLLPNNQVIFGMKAIRRGWNTHLTRCHTTQCTHCALQAQHITYMTVMTQYPLPGLYCVKPIDQTLSLHRNS